MTSEIKPINVLIFFIALVLIFCNSLLAEEVQKKNEGQKPEALLAAITKVYRTFDLVETTIEKKISYEWKPKQDLSTGRFLYSKGKLRTEFNSPEKNWTIYNSKEWWSIEFASPDFPGKNKVTHTKVSKKDKAQFFLLKLIDLKKPSEQFKIEVESQENEVVTLKLASKENTQGVSDIRVILDTKEKWLKEVSFKDDMGNKTTITLGVPDLKKSIPEGLINYKPNKKEDEVTEI
jgi:outer membrane lipoprotein carrier protein